MTELSRLPSVRSVAKLREAKASHRKNELLSIQRLGGLRRIADEIRTESETLMRICEKYSAHLSDDETLLGPAVRLEICREARAAIAAVSAKIERMAAGIPAKTWSMKQ